MSLLGNTNNFYLLEVYNEWQNVPDLWPIVVFTEGEIKLLGNKNMEQTEMFWKCLTLPPAGVYLI